jgi:hypothetical protein
VAEEFCGQQSAANSHHRIFEELFAKLNPEDSEDDCQRVAIAGLGGVGKTQIALEAAFQIQKAFPDRLVFRIWATSSASFEKGFHDISQALQVPGINKDKADVKLLVKTFLSQESASR